MDQNQAVLQKPAGVKLHTGTLTLHWDATGWMLFARGIKEISLPCVRRTSVEVIRVTHTSACITPYPASVSSEQVMKEVRNLNPCCQVQFSSTTATDR